MKNKKKANLTELVFIIDRSGSMAGLESDTIGGFNAMLNKQKETDGVAYVTTVLFDSRYKTLHDRKKLHRVPNMTAADYTVGGCTALLDAIGGTIEHIKNIHKYARPSDVPQKTMFVITTDGMENASRLYTKEKVRALIESQKEKGWEFLFIGANIDAVSTAQSFGISRDRSVNYNADSQGTKVVYDAVSKAVGNIRCAMPLSACWSEEIEKDYNSRQKALNGVVKAISKR